MRIVAGSGAACQKCLQSVSLVAVMNSYGYQRIIVLACLVSLLAGAGQALALTLYRYVDAEGTVVVVDSIDKVPGECRNSVRVETIGRMESPRSSEETTPAGRLDSGPQESPAVEFTQNSASNQNFGTFEENISAKTASETEIPDYEHASASLWLGEMQAMLRRNDEIWHTANAFTPYHRRILVLQEENLRAADQLRGFDSMTWQGHQDWVDRARGANDQLRQLAFTISLWIRQNPEQIKLQLAPLQNRVRMVLDLIAQSLPAARKGNE